jgi:hypothetical protein
MSADPLILAVARAEREKEQPHVLDGIIRRLWWRAFDTFEIAKYLQLEESFVAKRLAVIRDRS